MKDITYRCNICCVHIQKDPDKIIGFETTQTKNGERLQIKHARNVERHVCYSCLFQLYELMSYDITKNLLEKHCTHMGYEEIDVYELLARKNGLTDNGYNNWTNKHGDVYSLGSLVFRYRDTE